MVGGFTVHGSMASLIGKASVGALAAVNAELGGYRGHGLHRTGRSHADTDSSAARSSSSDGRPKREKSEMATIDMAKATRYEVR